MQNEIKENLREAYDNFANDREKSELQGWKVETRQNFLELLKMEDKQSILEIGAGTGKDSKFFKDNGLKVNAVDLSCEMIKLPRKGD